MRKLDRKPILQEIESQQKQIEDLRKQIDSLEKYVEWGCSFLEELLNIVGINMTSSQEERDTARASLLHAIDR